MIGVRCCVDDPSGALVFSFGDFYGFCCVNFWGFGLGFWLGVINMKCELVDPNGLLKQLMELFQSRRLLDTSANWINGSDSQ
ncbi:hypothetical protein ACFX15_036096 [Malus domestica]